MMPCQSATAMRFSVRVRVVPGFRIPTSVTVVEKQFRSGCWKLGPKFICFRVFSSFSPGKSATAVQADAGNNEQRVTTGCSHVCSSLNSEQTTNSCSFNNCITTCFPSVAAYDQFKELFLVCYRSILIC